MLTEDQQVQYKALTDGVGYTDLGDRTQIEVTGRDRAAFLHNFCTNDIKQLTPGHGCEAFVTSVQGKTLGYVFIFCTPDSLIVETVAGQAEALIGHLDRYVITEDVQFHDRTGAWSELLIGGQTSRSLLEGLFAAELPDQAMQCRSGKLGGVRVSLRRVDLTRPLSYLLGCSRQETPRVSQALAEAGAVCCDAAAVEVARIEAGSPFYGKDITDKNFPQEVDRNEKAINFVKGCYLGQETVARIDSMGHVNRTLVGIKFEGDSIPSSATELFVAGKAVGHVTSAGFSPKLNAPLALGYVRREHNQPGTKLTSDYGDAEVVQLPVGDPASDHN